MLIYPPLTKRMSRSMFLCFFFSCES